MGKRFEHFTKNPKKYTEYKLAQEKMLNIISLWKMQTKTTTNYHYTPIKDA